MQEMQETQIQSLGGKANPLEEELATHSRILVKSPVDRRAWQGYRPWDRRARHD